MRKIIIINTPDSFSKTNIFFLINAVNEKMKHAEIHILGFKKDAELLELIPTIKKIHYIDEKFLATIKTSKIFSPAYAVNHLQQILSEIKAKKWDILINVADNTFSNSISSVIDADEKIGTLFSEGVTKKLLPIRAQVENKFWHSRQNFKFSDESLYNSIGAYPRPAFLKVKIDEDALKKCSRNFGPIRQKMEDADGPIKFIGIDLNAINDEFIGIETLSGLVARMLNSRNLLPIFLMDDSNTQKEIINQLNNRLGSKLISIGMSHKMSPAVLVHLDLIIVKSIELKNIASATDTPTLEIKRQNSSNNWSYDSFILETRSSRPTVEDLLNSINFIVGKNNVISLTAQCNLRRSKMDDLGPTWENAKKDNGQQEQGQWLNYQFARLYYRTVIENKVPLSLDLFFKIIGPTNELELKEWTSKQRDELTLLTKNLLNALRSLKSTLNGQISFHDFMDSFEHLMSSQGLNGMGEILVEQLAHDVDALPMRDFKENQKKLEEYMFELKSKIKTTISFIDSIESNASRRSTEAISNTY